MVTAIDEAERMIWIITAYKPDPKNMEPYIHKKKPIMKCPHCKSELKQGTNVLTFQLNSNQIVVVKDVPALVCEQCGDESLDLETSKIVEKQVQQAVADGIQMGFINFNTAA